MSRPENQRKSVSEDGIVVTRLITGGFKSITKHVLRLTGYRKLQQGQTLIIKVFTHILEEGLHCFWETLPLWAFII